MNLVQAELERLGARRFVQLMLVLLVAAFAVTIASTIAGSHQPSTDQVLRARGEMQQQINANQRWQRECREALEQDAPPDLRAKYPLDCDAVVAQQPQLEDFLFGVFVFERQVRGLVYFLITFLTLFGFLVGASFIGRRPELRRDDQPAALATAAADRTRHQARHPARRRTRGVGGRVGGLPGRVLAGR